MMIRRTQGNVLSISLLSQVHKLGVKKVYDAFVCDINDRPHGEFELACMFPQYDESTKELVLLDCEGGTVLSENDFPAIEDTEEDPGAESAL